MRLRSWERKKITFSKIALWVDPWFWNSWFILRFLSGQFERRDNVEIKNLFSVFLKREDYSASFETRFESLNKKLSNFWGLEGKTKLLQW